MRTLASTEKILRPGRFWRNSSSTRKGSTAEMRMSRVGVGGTSPLPHNCPWSHWLSDNLQIRKEDVNLPSTCQSPPPCLPAFPAICSLQKHQAAGSFLCGTFPGPPNLPLVTAQPAGTMPRKLDQGIQPISSKGFITDCDFTPA